MLKPSWMINARSMNPKAGLKVDSVSWVRKMSSLLVPIRASPLPNFSSERA